MQGHINAGRIDRSRRLQVILELLKRSDYPLSSEEIARQAYDHAQSGRIMLNVSTNIGEMRAQVNRDAGYIVSEAAAWKDGKYPWHDGRPRYWLIAAPGWTPRWRITEEGILVPTSSPALQAPQPAQDHQPDEPRLCSNPACRKPLPAGERYTCDDACNRAWRDSIRPAFSATGGLF